MSTTPTNTSVCNSNDNRFSRRKRGLDPELDKLELTSVAKKQKPYEMTSNDLNEIKSFFLNMKVEIENKIGASQSSIETKINELSATVNTEVNELKSSFNDLK